MATVVGAGSGQPAEYNHQVPIRPRAFISKSDSPITPRTPLLGRSISGAFGSPGAYSRELDEVVVYEIDQRHISAGFAGEPRPRVIWRFGYGMNESNRTGDYMRYAPKQSCENLEAEDISQHELYRADLRHVDFSLLHARLERIVRFIHTDHLQLDQKPRKVVLTIPTLLPTRVLDAVVNVLFNHYTQPPSITLLTSPAMTCVSAGLRSGLIIDIGWEETIVTAIGEYKVVNERRSVRAEKMLLSSIDATLREKCAATDSTRAIPFAFLEEVRARMVWSGSSRSKVDGEANEQRTITLLEPSGGNLEISMSQLSEPVEKTFFAHGSLPNERRSMDDNELLLPELAYEVLAHLSSDFRASCASRVVITGQASLIPGLKRRLLAELQERIDRYKWNPVINRGSVDVPATPKAVASAVAVERGGDESSTGPTQNGGDTKDAIKTDSSNTITDEIPTTQAQDEESRTQPNLEGTFIERLERETDRRRPETWNGAVRFVESLGAWCGASMIAGLKVKGINEIDREDYLKHGLKDQNLLYI